MNPETLYNDVGRLDLWWSGPSLMIYKTAKIGKNIQVLPAGAVSRLRVTWFYRLLTGGSTAR